VCVCQVLFKFNANINAKMDDNMTPMMLSVLKDKPAALRVLLARNCEIFTQVSASHNCIMCEPRLTNNANNYRIGVDWIVTDHH
jgi:hypothetical protein